MRVGLLGSVELHCREQAVDLGGPRQRAVLATLALRANEVVSVDHLVDAVWEAAPASPASNVRTYVLGLRKRLRDGGENAHRLITRAPGYVLRTRPDEVDVAVFEELAASGARTMGQGDLAGAVALLREALGLWRGNPLEGLDLGQALRAEVARLTERRLTVSEQYVQALIDLGSFGEAVSELRRLVVEHPLRENLWVLLIRALSLGGRQFEALDAYQQVRRLLAEEVGVEPCAQLQRVQLSILTADKQQRASGPDTARIVSHVVPRPKLLPPDIIEFTGRAAELEWLRQFATSHPDRALATPICVLSGMPGVGKTRLAVRAAHEITRSGRFDQVQLYADLKGFSPEREPMAPTEVLARFLRALGVAVEAIPHDIEDRVALYRDRLHGRRTLLLLDNVASEEQVQPLLPGGPGSLVLITSRRSLSGMDGVRRLSLGAFSPAEAITLLRRVAGEHRVAAEPDTADRIVALCDNVPLAVALAARRLEVRQAWTLTELLTRLGPADQRLNQLTMGRRDIDITFGPSYYALSPDEQRVFRLLALHPGADVTPASVAALTGHSPQESDELLEGLLDHHLVSQTRPGRYRIDGLLRLYAVRRAHTDETAARRRSAQSEVLRWYMYSADAASHALDPHRRSDALDQTAVPLHVPEFDTHAGALEWFENEHANLVAAVELAVEAGMDDFALRILDAMFGRLSRRAHRHWIPLYETALAAARRLGDRRAEAVALDRLGLGHSENGRSQLAIEHHSRALEIHRETRDQAGQAGTMLNLGVAHRRAGQYDRSLSCLRPALCLFRRTRDRRGQRDSLVGLADTYRGLGRLSDASDALRQADAARESR